MLAGLSYVDLLIIAPVLVILVYAVVRSGSFAFFRTKLEFQRRSRAEEAQEE